MKKCVLRSFAKFTEKHLCQSPFCNKKSFCEIFKNTFFTEHLRMTASGDISFQKSPVRMNFLYLFDSLLIIVLRLAVKSISLRFGGLHIPTIRTLFLGIVYFIVRSFMIVEIVL